jgi:two-component system chemotaxis response regulator CheB
MIDVLVVDDGVVTRRMLSEVLAADPELRVTAAADGRIALQKIKQAVPDVITLDLEMPGLNGIETLKAIRLAHPALPVIMYSAYTEEGAAQTLEALVSGASDYVTKPSNPRSVTDARACIRDQLIPKIKALCGGEALVEARVLAPARSEMPRAGPDAVVIGVSTGGPTALAVVLRELPRDLAVPVLIVQHMPPMFTTLLAERLNRRASLPVLEAVDGGVVQPGTIYLAPGDQHLAVERRAGHVVMLLTKGPPENSCRPAADVLFRTASEVYQDRLLAVVMTGMGQDGMRGCREIRARGGQVLVQDQSSSVVWGMPGLVAEAGLADQVVPLDGIGGEIARRCSVGPSHAATGEARRS